MDHAAFMRRHHPRAASALGFGGGTFSAALTSGVGTRAQPRLAHVGLAQPQPDESLAPGPAAPTSEEERILRVTSWLLAGAVLT